MEGALTFALEFAGRSWVWFQHGRFRLNNMDGVESWNRMDHGLGAGRIWVWLNNMDRRRKLEPDGSWTWEDGFRVVSLFSLLQNSFKVRFNMDWVNMDRVRGWVSN